MKGKTVSNSLKSIEEQWEVFSEMVFRKTPAVPPGQREELKKTFFAGAWALFASVEELGMPHVSKQEAVAFLKARRAECATFLNKIMAEYAERN